MNRIQLAQNSVQWRLLGKQKLNFKFNKSWVTYEIIVCQPLVRTILMKM
jgi:hypothetical protein